MSKRRRIAAAIATACVAIAPLGVQAPAEAAIAQSRIVRMPATVTLSADAEFVKMRVTYRCVNNFKWAHFLVAHVTDHAGATYVLGYRNDVGGIDEATCTGDRLTQVLRVRRSLASASDYLERGQVVDLTFSLERRRASTHPDGGGWYVFHSAINAERSVTVL